MLLGGMAGWTRLYFTSQLHFGKIRGVQAVPGLREWHEGSGGLVREYRQCPDYEWMRGQEV